MTAPQGAAPKKSLSVSRLVLLLILVGALGALGFDFYSRQRMGKLDEELKHLVDETENKSLQGVSKEKVHSKIGREPTRASSKGDLEEYDFPGVFYIHRVTVNYRPIDSYDGHKAQSVFRIGAE